MFIADENIPIQIIDALQNSNIEIFSIFEQARGISDVEIINLAQCPPRIILTEHKDSVPRSFRLRGCVWQFITAIEYF